MASRTVTPPRTDYFQRLPQLGASNAGQVAAKNGTKNAFATSSPYTLRNNSKPSAMKPVRKFLELKSELPYESLKDPSLSYYFTKPIVQKHLMENGWFEANAECSICNSKNRGEIKLCTGCQTFTHLNCLAPSPISNTGLKVLLIHFLPDHADIKDLKELLTAQGHFTTVDDWDAKHHRPTLDTLIQYDSVLVFGFREEGVDKGRWREPDSLGDSLAEYALGSARKKTFKKGGVVIAGLSHALALGGKWRRYKMNPLLTGRPVTTPGLTLGQVSLPNHPLMENVHKLNGGYRSYHVTGAVNESGASIVARWSNGTPLTVVLDHHSKVERGRVVSLNVLPCPQFKVGQHKDEYWDALTDGAVMISNALRFTAEPTYHKDKGLYLCEECKIKPVKEVPKSLYDQILPLPVSPARSRRPQSSASEYTTNNDPETETLKGIYRAKLTVDIPIRPTPPKKERLDVNTKRAASPVKSSIKSPAKSPVKNKAESRSSFKGICPPAETVELDEGVENSGFSLNDEFMYEGYIPTEKFDEEGKKEFSVPLERLDGDEDMAKLPGSPGTKSPKKSALHSPVKSKTISQSPRAPSPGKSIASSQRTRVNTAHSRKSPVPADVTADENQNAIKKLELTASEDSDGTKTNQEPTTQSLSDKQVAHPQDSTVSEHKSILPEVFPNAPTEKPQNTLVDEPKEQTSFFAFLSMSPKVVRVDSISIQKHVEVANEPDREQRTNDTEDLSESNSTKQQEAEISPQKMDIEITSKLSESISGPVPVPSPVDVPQVKVRPPSGLSRSVGSMAAISKPTQANLKKNAKSSEALRNSARPTAKTKPVTSPRTGKSQSGIKLQSAAGSKSAVTATRSKSIAANSKGSREMLQSVNSRKLSGSKELMKSGISVSRGSKDILKSSDGKVSRSNLGSTALYGSTKVSKSMGNRENSKSFGSKQNLKSTGSIQNLKSTTSRGSKTPLLRGSQRDVVAKTSITVVKKNTSSSQRIASRSLDTLASKLSPPQSQNARKVNSTSKIASKINHSVKNAPQARSPKLKQAPSQKSETKLKKVEGNQSVRSVKQSQTALEPKNSNFSVVALEPRESLLNPEASDFSGGVTSGAPSELSLSQAPSMYQMEIPVAGQEYQMEATSRSDKFLPFLPPKAPEITETPAYKYQNRVMSDDGEIVWSSLDPYSVEPEKQAVVSVQELVTIQEPEKVLGRRLSDDGEIIWSSATEAQT